MQFYKIPKAQYHPNAKIKFNKEKTMPRNIKFPGIVPGNLQKLGDYYITYAINVARFLFRKGNF